MGRALRGCPWLPCLVSHACGLTPRGGLRAWFLFLFFQVRCSFLLSLHFCDVAELPGHWPRLATISTMILQSSSTCAPGWRPAGCVCELLVLSLPPYRVAFRVALLASRRHGQPEATSACCMEKRV